MTPAQLQTIEEIFHAALDYEPGQIAAFLDTACAGDELLRRKVETLLTSHAKADSFIETPTVGLAARIIEKEQAAVLIGQAISHYKILEWIGSGGMGEVYLASDITAGRKAALKLLPMRFTGDAQRLTRFQQEARAVVALNHPNIVTVYEVGEYDSSHYIASELIEGETLRQRLAREPMELGEALDVAIQVATALAAAHQAGIVHRDIKPENIMLRPDGYAKVLDFGIAKLAEQEPMPGSPPPATMATPHTRFGSIMGTVSYMSPEQARGEAVTNASDIWSLGVVLAEILGMEGRAPDRPGRHGGRPSIPNELKRVIDRMLAPQPNERYSDGRQLAEELKRVRRLTEQATSTNRFYAPVLITIGAVATAVALALAAYYYRHTTPERLPNKSIAVLPSRT